MDKIKKVSVEDADKFVLGNITPEVHEAYWTETVHYLSYFKVGTEHPNFHRPDYFGKLVLDKKV